jgi:hypothetical protein
MDGKRHRVYRSIREGIEAQAAFLKAGYISKGLTTIPQIGRKYSPTGASNDPYNTNWQWPSGVQREYNRIRAASLKDTTAASAPRAGGGGGPAPTSVMMNPTINVTGVSGSPEAIGQRVAAAMRRPAQIVLDEIKRARQAEARLGYV